ncbi:hypothetical protein CRG98_047562, partial [Punica granatum]
IFDLRSPTPRSSRRKNRVSWVTRARTGPLRVPFRPMTSASRTITFKGFLTTLSLPHEEVVTVHLGLGTFGSVHERLDPPLRSPTSLTSHRAVPGTSVPTPFFPSCRDGLLFGSHTRSFKLSLATPTAASPTLFLTQRG